MAAHGRYRLLRKVAEGGTAEVFLAHQLGPAGFKRRVVLKRVRPALWSDESFRRMLIDEAHISMALHHSNIVQVLDIGLAGSHYFLVFELVDGWSLSQVVKRARAAQLELPLNLVLHVIAQVCRALAYAHSRAERGVPMGIVHRDISPQNVLLSEQGEVKLADFGIAKAHSRITTSQVGKVKGKPAYMSPEQITGAPVDARANLFSLGICLYWVVTGELPFDAPNEREAMARVVYGRFVPAEKKRPGVPKPVARLIARALEHDVKDRFQSADEMLAEVEKIQRGNLLPPGGETELKAWLAALAARDGARPIGWIEEGEQPPAAPPTDEIELVDDVDIVMVAEASGADAAVSPPPLPRKSAARPWMLGGLAAALLAGGYGLSRGSRAAPGPAHSRLEIAAPAPIRGDSRRDDAGEVATLALARSQVDGAADAAVAQPLELRGGSEDAGSVDGSSVGGGAEMATPDAGSAVGGAPESGSADGGDTSGGEVDGGAADGANRIDGSVDCGILDAGDVSLVDAGASDRDDVRPGAASAATVSPTPKPAEGQGAASGAPARTKGLSSTRESASASSSSADPFPDMVPVLFESEPPGADVSIERKVFGKTPIALKLRAGITFEVVFAKAGYKTHKVLYTVTTRPGQRVRVALPR